VTALTSTAVSKAAGVSAWAWPIDVTRYNRRPELTEIELEALRRLGMNNLRRRRCYDEDAPEWAVVQRLLRPLDDARAALWCPDTTHHRRAISDAIGLVLLRCAEDSTSYWAWSEDDWLRLIGTSVAEFERPWPGWIDVSLRKSCDDGCGALRSR